MRLQWKRSSFTSVITSDTGELFLHNSFMGAVARIPATHAGRVAQALREGIWDSESTDAAIEELCYQGFFVPADLEERKAVIDLLDRERSDRLGLMILPHENCNFRCIYCYEKFKRGRMKAEVVDGIKAFVEREIGKYRGLGVAWFGGEPLLGYDVICELSQSLIETCNRHCVTYSSGMSTNGSLLTPEMVGSLFEYKIKSFQICVDGPEAIHNRKRKLAGGGGTYRKIIGNLMSMRDRKDDFFVSIRVNFDNESVPFIERWLDEEIAPAFAHDSRFGLHFEPVTKRGGPNDSMLDVCAPDVASSHRAAFFTKARALGFSDLNVKKCLIPHGFVCYAAREAAFIVGTDGTVYKCSLVLDDPRNKVGNLTADGQLLLDPLKSRMWTTLAGRDTTACENCALFASCQGRKCPLMTIKQNRPVCPITNELYATLVRLVALDQGPSGEAALRAERGDKL